MSHQSHGFKYHPLEEDSQTHTCSPSSDLAPKSQTPASSWLLPVSIWMASRQLKLNMVDQAPDLPTKPPHQQPPHPDDGKFTLLIAQAKNPSSHPWFSHPQHLIQQKILLTIHETNTHLYHYPFPSQGTCVLQKNSCNFFSLIYLFLPLPPPIRSS